jgi:serine phosphatase RsbU (regulator of sigma subunit)/DNA-binding response OmpR family regulator
LKPQLLEANSAELEDTSILLVDDDSAILDTLVDIFETMGFRIDTASTGTQALARLENRRYDVALLDIRLPDMLGTDLLARARRIQPDLKCIMATGNASKENAVAALNMGAHAYLEKPIDLDQVKAIIRTALSQQRLERDNQRLLSQLQALSDITDAALTTLELNDLLAQVLDQFLHHHHANRGTILIQDPATGRWRLRDNQGNLRESEGGEVLGHGVFATAHAQRLVVTSEGAELAHDPVVQGRSPVALAAPLPSRAGDPMAGVVIERQEQRPFTPEEVELARHFAERAGVLIEHARLYSDERRLRADAEAFSGLASRLVERIGLSERLQLIGDYLLQVSECERCIIWLVRDRRLICAGAQGVTPAQFRLLRRQNIAIDNVSGGVRDYLNLVRPAVVDDMRDSGLLAANLVEDWGIRAVLLLPLRFEGRSVGLVTIDSPDRRLAPTDRQIQRAATVTFMSAGAIQQALTIQEERDVAQTLAESFLSRPPRLPDVQIADRYVPASEVAQVGGDYYDFVTDEANHRIGFVIGDVCGKGIEATRYVAMAKFYLRAYALESSSPAWIMGRLNRALYTQMSEECTFITMFFGVLDRQTGNFIYTNAAHPPPILRDGATGKLLELEPNGPRVVWPDEPEEAEARPHTSTRTPTNGMVGAFETMEFTEHSLTLPPESVFALFTDGVTEARSEGYMLESSGVRDVIREHATQSPTAIANAIYSRAMEAGAGMLRDDVAIVVAKRASPSPDG